MRAQKKKDDVLSLVSPRLCRWVKESKRRRIIFMTINRALAKYTTSCRMKHKTELRKKKLWSDKQDKWNTFHDYQLHSRFKKQDRFISDI